MNVFLLSVNIKSDDFVSNENSDSCAGHKWGLTALFKYLESEEGINTDKVWNDICNVVIKTIIASDSVVSSAVKANVSQRSCVHELFGFDVMLDNNLKPWIIEVNISPSLHSASQLDRDIKGRLLRDVFNLAGFRLPLVDTLPAATTVGKSSKSTDSRCSEPIRPKKTTQSSTRKSTTNVKTATKTAATGPSKKASGFDGGLPFMGSRSLTAAEKSKHTHYLKHPELADTIIDHLTDDDILMLMETEAESMRKGDLEQLLPNTLYAHNLKYVSYTDLI